MEYRIRLNWKMNQEEKRVFLIEELKKESSVMRGIAVPKEEEAQKMLLRGLMNVRMAKPTSVSFQKVQDEYLQTETEKKGITKLSSLSPVAVIPRAAAPKTDSPQGEEVAPASDSEHLRGESAAPHSGSESLRRDEAVPPSGNEHHTDAFLYLWQGDITTLAADAIVNAANSAMTMPFTPLPASSYVSIAMPTCRSRQVRREPLMQSRPDSPCSLPLTTCHRNLFSTPWGRS